MKIGVLREIKIQENRVAMTPAGAEILTDNGHEVFIEKDAGLHSGFADSEYTLHGAKICIDAKQIYNTCEMVIHVKEPQQNEIGLIRDDQIIITYLHLAASRELTESLLQTRGVFLAYETIQKQNGSLPLLIPMSEVAGRMAIQQGAKYLEMEWGGRGVLLGGVPGVEPGTVLILGAGTVGLNAAQMAAGLGAKVYILDQHTERLRFLQTILPPNCFTIASSPSVVRELIKRADVVVGSALNPGARAPKIVTKPMLKTMKKGSVLVDVSIDQGGCFETSKPTTHDDPIYEVDGVIHYCVTNMPGAVAQTSTLALTNATLPYILELANKGYRKALLASSELALGANIIRQNITCPGVSQAFDLPFVSVEDALGG